MAPSRASAEIGRSANPHRTCETVGPARRYCQPPQDRSGDHQPQRVVLANIAVNTGGFCSCAPLPDVARPG